MSSQVTNYQCPACTGPLQFDPQSGKLVCEYCGSEFDPKEIEAQYAEKEAKAQAAKAKADAQYAQAVSQIPEGSPWSEAEAGGLKVYNCPSCGAEIICDQNTAATSCVYCGNPSVVPGQLSGGLKPDFVIPFKKTKEEALAALEEARSQGGHRLVFRGGEAERSAPWRVMIVEDQELVRLHFASLVQSSPAYQLLYSIRNADLVDVDCEGGEVDLILMDVYTEQGADGLAAAGRIKARFPHVRIIIVTSMPEVSWLDRARAAGVDSFWYKEVHRSSLLELMDRTMAGESVYPDKTPPVPLGQVSSEDLSRRELEILRQILSGDTNEEIARRLFISPATVKTHISSLLQKTGFKSRPELAIRARESELVIW